MTIISCLRRSIQSWPVSAGESNCCSVENILRNILLGGVICWTIPSQRYNALIWNLRAPVSYFQHNYVLLSVIPLQRWGASMVVVVHHHRCLLHLLQYEKVPLHPQGDLRLLRLWPVGLNLGHLGLSTQSTLWVLGRIIHSWIGKYCVRWMKNNNILMVLRGILSKKVSLKAFSSVPPVSHQKFS